MPMINVSTFTPAVMLARRSLPIAMMSRPRRVHAKITAAPAKNTRATMLRMEKMPPMRSLSSRAIRQRPALGQHEGDADKYQQATERHADRRQVQTHDDEPLDDACGQADRQPEPESEPRVMGAGEHGDTAGHAVHADH